MVVFQEITDIVFKAELYSQAALLGVIVTAMPPYFAMDNAENHKVMNDHVLKFQYGLLLKYYFKIIISEVNENTFMR